MIDLPLVSLDLELIGVDDDAEIIEVGAVRFRGGESLDSLQVLIRPSRPLPHRIAELTGLGAADFQHAVPLEEALERVSAFVGSAPIVGQSIGHDLKHLRNAGLDLGNRMLDTFELATLLQPGLPAYDLQSVARALGVTGQRPHRALADAELARDVFLALADSAFRMDLDVLSHVVRLSGPLDWPLRLVFDEAQRAKVREMIGSGSLADRSADNRSLPGFVAAPAQRQPLAPTEIPQLLSVDDLDAALGRGGVIGQSLDGFEERSEQQAVARAIAETFNDGGVLVAEAGTGTGKSLAYLLPALTYASTNDRRVIVSTNTINLQDQLFAKDVPDVLRATGLEARVSVLKGRSNYLCLRRWLTLLRSDELSAGERLLLIKTLLWLPWTGTGDRAELRLTSAEEEAWGRVAATTETCSPALCLFHREGTCWVARARRRAEDSHVVIVNHSLLLSDLVAGSQVVPEYLHLVVDEAHHLEDEATTQLGRRMTMRELGRRLDRLSDPAARHGVLGDAIGAVREVLEASEISPISDLVAQAELRVESIRADMKGVGSKLAQFIRASARGGEAGIPSVRITPAVRAQPAWSDVDVAWGELSRLVLDLETTLSVLLSKLEPLVRRSEAVADVVAEMADGLAFWSEARRHGNSVVAEADQATVAWITIGQGEDLGLNAAPLDVADVLRERLIEPRESVVMTSATLAVEGRFDFFRSRLGLDDARELAVGSPFNYATSALVYLPANSAEPNQPGYQRGVEQIILDVTSELGGRTLVLFTSYSQLRTTYSALREPLDKRKIILLGQRMDGSSRTRLLETFRSGSPCVLMGTSSFWEGVDVVGEALSCVIMARLPFAPPTDPIVEARSEQYDEPFRQYTLPVAALRFRQGFGRLIRSASDRGVMVVLDARLRTRNYRWSFLRSLPPCPVKTGPASEAGQVASDWVAGRVRL